MIIAHRKRGMEVSAYQSGNRHFHLEPTGLGMDTAAEPLLQPLSRVCRVRTVRRSRKCGIGADLGTEHLASRRFLLWCRAKHRAPWRSPRIPHTFAHGVLGYSLVRVGEMFLLVKLIIARILMHNPIWNANGREV